jgi:hypothetical protein
VASPLSVSVSFTVAPNTAREPESLAGSITSAWARMLSMSRERPSMNP